MQMEINATIQVNLENGKMLFVFMVKTIEEQHMLYEYISKNLEYIRQYILDVNPHVNYVTTGCWHDPNILDWGKDYIVLS